jgi:CBS domain-containing protein
MPISEAAAKMRKHSIGALVVMDGDEPAGIVTDRDIVVRVLAKQFKDRPVSEAMSPQVFVCDARQDVATVTGLMGDHQVRRLLVLDEQNKLVGIVSLADIAEHASEELAGQALGEISESRYP